MVEKPCPALVYVFVSKSVSLLHWKMAMEVLKSSSCLYPGIVPSKDTKKRIINRYVITEPILISSVLNVALKSYRINTRYYGTLF